MIIFSTWSLNRTAETGWPESNSDVSNSPVGVEKGVQNMDSQWAAAASSQGSTSGSYGLDIKPFEPGKPWMDSWQW